MALSFDAMVCLMRYVECIGRKRGVWKKTSLNGRTTMRIKCGMRLGKETCLIHLQPTVIERERYRGKQSTTK